MAFNNGFPMGYGQLYPQLNPYQPPQMMQSQEQTGPIWVQGEAGAKSFLVGPGKTVALWASEAQVIYLKSADPSGMPSMKQKVSHSKRSRKQQNSKTKNFT